MALPVILATLGGAGPKRVAAAGPDGTATLVARLSTADPREADRILVEAVQAQAAARSQRVVHSRTGVLEHWNRSEEQAGDERRRGQARSYDRGGC